MEKAKFDEVMSDEFANINSANLHRLFAPHGRLMERHKRKELRSKLNFAVVASPAQSRTEQMDGEICLMGSSAQRSIANVYFGDSKRPPDLEIVDAERKPSSSDFSETENHKIMVQGPPVVREERFINALGFRIYVQTRDLYGKIYCHVLRVSGTNNSTWIRIGYRFYSLWRLQLQQVTITKTAITLVASRILLTELHYESRD
jgi:hypothetical protein